MSVKHKGEGNILGEENATFFNQQENQQEKKGTEIFRMGNVIHFPFLEKDL